MRTYKVTLANGSDRHVSADDVEFHDNGSITFLNRNGERVIAFAPGSWTTVEVEARDGSE